MSASGSGPRRRTGREVPISVIRRKDYPKDGSGRLFLYGYGSYGMAMPPSFNARACRSSIAASRFAIAHVRGGDELGHRWYREGKLEKKTNTFSDFIACAETLIESGYASAGPDRHPRRLGRRHADGRGHQHAAGALALRRRRGAVRRRA